MRNHLKKSKLLLNLLFSIIFIVSCETLSIAQQQITPPIQSFNAGELSPKLDFRTDIEKYHSGDRTLENMIPLVEGGVTRMPGTYFAYETSDSSQQSRLIPFQFSTIQSYVIEAGDEYFRFFKDDGLITTVDEYTSLLLHGDGDNNAVTFTDSGSTGHTVGYAGDVVLKTGAYKFGTASIRSAGSASDYLTIPDDLDWRMSTGRGTVDFWIAALGTVSDDVGFFEQATDVSDNQVVCKWIYSTGKLRFFIKNAGSLDVNLQGTADITDGSWHHIAIIKGWGAAADNWALTFDGTAIDTDIGNASEWPNVANPLLIFSGNSAYFYGRIDEFRWSKGVARWTSNFTPPTQAYPFADVYTLTGGGYEPYEITSPYAASDVFEIKTVQSADYLYLFHPDYPPKQLTRTGDASWTLSDFQTKISDEMVISDITKASPAVVTCTTVNSDLANGDIVYITDVGGMTEVNDLYFTVASVTTGAAGHFQLSGINSSSYTAYTSGGTAQENLYGTDDNQPSWGAFFEQRMVLGGSNNYPQTVNLSATADYNDFNTGTDDDEAIQYTIVSDKVDRIYWGLGLDYLMLGTEGGIWRLGATSARDPLTPSDIVVKKQISIGAKNIQPNMVGDSILWATRAGTSVRKLDYSIDVDKFIAPDLTRIAKHITLGDTREESGITQMDFQVEPLPILWSIRADGVLLGMTYETQENIYSWFRVVTDGSFESVAVISVNNAEDQIWVIVNRTIDGSTVRYVEYFKPIEFFGDIQKGFFVHSGLTYDGNATSTITNLDHLEGETVAILADGLVQTSKTVSSGSITLETAASYVHIGLPYTSIVEPMKLSEGSQLGTTRGKKQRINKIVAVFYETGDGVQYGPDQDTLKDFTGLTAGSLTTDNIEMIFNGNWDDEATITIEQAEPLPLTLLGIVPWLTVNEVQ